MWCALQVARKLAITVAVRPPAKLPTNNQFFLLCKALHNRKNFLFVGSDAGGKAAAICLSILASAKRNGVEPWAYLKDIFTHINDVRTSQLDQFLPDVWFKSQSSDA